MMGSSHAATGVLAGAAIGVLCGSDPVDVLSCAAIGAGAALLPDLDEPGSTVGRSLGLVTEKVSEKLREASRHVYQRTATDVELAAAKDGAHRYLTHTVPACAAFGLVALVVAAIAPLSTGLVVFAMAALGLGTVARSLKKWGPARKRRLAASVMAVVIAAGAMFAEGGGPAPWLIGVTVAGGALTHVLGDWLTRSGVPLAWPFVVRGKRWWMFRSPVAFHTGKSRVEDGIRWASLAGLPLMLVLSWPPPTVG
ncbi:metal-dependent hydrolase [Nocardiopsis sp. CNT312]|uniref:metal-dependent hydrolase n=1 Tax=Nocardiopsis sp. CNT312 TaxID=1137268 RepID=UPI00048AF64A|nr:metal-dependent hydrolase [Nocardiopsis sp. CNT312]